MERGCVCYRPRPSFAVKVVSDSRANSPALFGHRVANDFQNISSSNIYFLFNSKTGAGPTNLSTVFGLTSISGSAILKPVPFSSRFRCDGTAGVLSEEPEGSKRALPLQVSYYWAIAPFFFLGV